MVKYKIKTMEQNISEKSGLLYIKVHDSDKELSFRF